MEFFEVPTNGMAGTLSHGCGVDLLSLFPSPENDIVVILDHGRELGLLSPSLFQKKDMAILHHTGELERPFPPLQPLAFGTISHLEKDMEGGRWL